MDSFVKLVTQDFPQFSFVGSNQFRWSSKDQEISYDESAKDPAGLWAFLHELGHGLLNHQEYHSDFGLLKLEVAAWQEAEQLAEKYKLKIDKDHVQNCLDSYRDWLHRRSTCPNCGTHSVQTDDKSYRCFNCHSTWQVTTSRFCRPYRKSSLAQNKKSLKQEAQAIFI